MANIFDFDWSYRWTRRDDFILLAMLVLLVASFIGALL